MAAGKSVAFVALLLYVSACIVCADSDHPIIGVFTLPSSATFSKDYYLAASYVKWLEAAGARVVPIQYETPEAELDVVFAGINGLLFTGGGPPPSNSSRYMFHLAMEANQNKDYFPVWGTCLGFEWIMEFVGGSKVVEPGYDAENLALPLNFSADAYTSHIGNVVGTDIMNLMGTTNITFNNHQQGLSVSTFHNSPLDRFFHLLSTNYDRSGKEFVSMVEGVDYPVYGVQFHPEKNIFEWGRNATSGEYYEVIPHTADAISMSQALGRFFVNEARRNEHAFKSPADEAARLIYNFPKTYTANVSTSFEEKYYFHEDY